MEPPDIVATPTGEVVIQPVEHASLVLSHPGEVIYVDPVGGADRYAGLPRPAAFLITHEHHDHFDVTTLEGLADGRPIPMVTSRGVHEKLPDALRRNARAVGYGEEAPLGAALVRAVEAYNTSPERLSKHPPGLGNGYVVTLGRLRIYIAGDTEPTADMLALTGIDVAFLPMNLPYTMTGAQAAEAVKTFRPRVVYPFHYGRAGAEPATFSALMEGIAGVEVRLRNWYPAG